jgi:hypothetical protein
MILREVKYEDDNIRKSSEGRGSRYQYTQYEPEDFESLIKYSEDLNQYDMR